MTVAAIQGEAGAFSHAAARQIFGDEVAILPCLTFDELVDSVSVGHATHGLVPVENTLAGSVPGNLSRLNDSNLHVIGETSVRVELCLITEPGRSLADVRSAASHPVALQQCLGFFRSRPLVQAVTVYDTAGSVRDLMSGDGKYDSAIASGLAADLYGGTVLLRGIEDHEENHTRFFAVSRNPSNILGGDARASLAFVVPHEPGSLHRALGFFAEAGLDLTRLESRPITGRPWEYRFYADLKGEAEEMLSAIRTLEGVANEVRVLGLFRSLTMPL